MSKSQLKNVSLSSFMLKKQLNIIIAFILLLGVVSCNSEKKVYESTDKEKKKGKSITIGRYNKLLKSGDMNAKYDAAVKYFKCACSF